MPKESERQKNNKTSMKKKIGDLKSMMAELTNLSKIWLFLEKTK